MPIDERMRQRAEEWITVGFLVVALGGGWYLVGPDRVTGDLDFVEVGWWNIRDLSSASRDDEEIALIARAMDGAEVLMVGELNDPQALEHISQELGASWEWAATEEKIGRSPHSAEHYGFLWNDALLELVDGVHVDPDPGDRFDREPAWATFRTLDGGLDFTVIGVHVTWGDRVADRKAEVRALRDVWERVQAATPDDDDLVLVGDFNRTIGDDSFDQLLAVAGMVRANEETWPTHVSSGTTYDQIFISLDFTREWTGEWETVRFDEELFADDDAAARLIGSDHRPVWITLAKSETDDDPGGS